MRIAEPMIKRHRNTIAIMIAFAVCVGFSPASTRSTRIIGSDAGGSVPAPGSSSPEVRRYRIDAGQSNFMVHAFVGGLLSGFGHNHNIAIKDISGETQFT